MRDFYCVCRIVTLTAECTISAIIGFGIRTSLRDTRTWVHTLLVFTAFPYVLNIVSDLVRDRLMDQLNSDFSFCKRPKYAVF
ncbi:hypothetical protein VTO42DRAFT_8490 [Malbranchea cinnamomea]